MAHSMQAFALPFHSVFQAASGAANNYAPTDFADVVEIGNWARRKMS
jgi:hypothetical protein